MGKIIITVAQCKRLVLPYIFSKYILPQMRKAYSGTIEAFLIQHTENFGGRNHPDLERNPKYGHNFIFMESGNIPDSKAKIVKQWTKQGKYSNFDGIIQHNTEFHIHPNMPTYKIGIEKALEVEADLHLWMDDDTIIYDLNLENWKQILKDKEVGVYISKDKCHYIQSAHFVSKPSFDKRILTYMNNPNIWNLCSYEKNTPEEWEPGPGHIEYFLTKEGMKSWGLLTNPLKQAFHGRTTRTIPEKSIYRIIEIVAPHEWDLLELDFGKKNIPLHSKNPKAYFFSKKYASIYLPN